MKKISEIVGRRLSISNRMIVKEAINRGVEIEKLPKKRFRMKHGNSKYLIRAGIVSAAPNTRLSRRLTRYKNATTNYLQALGYQVPENALFKKDEVDRAWNWAKAILPVVIKPNNGIMGKHVYVNIDQYNEFAQCFHIVAKEFDQVLIEEFVEGREFRFTFVNKEVVAVAERVPAHVVGNGKNTVEELIVLKNEERAKRKNPLHKKLKLDEESIRVLNKQDMGIDDIPEDGQRVYIRNNSNISTGGDAVDVTNSINPSIREEVEKAIKAIPGLRVCGVDVIIKDSDYHIIEINSHAMLAMHEYPWVGEKQDVINKVVDLMFPDTIQNRS